MTNKFETLKLEIADLKNAIDKGWAKDMEGKLADMEAELDALLAAENSDEVETEDESNADKVPDNTEIMQALMTAKEKVREQLLPEFEDAKIADFQLVASVVESFAEESVHTLAYEVPTALREQFNNLNAYLSFSSIISSDLNSREIKTEQEKKKWATVCTNYTIKSIGKFRNTDADKLIKVGSQIVTYSEALEYEHKPDNLLGILLVKFKTEGLEGKKKEVDAWLDINIDEARMLQKRWYAYHKNTILESLDAMKEFTPVRFKGDKALSYKLLLAIAKVWGEDHFNNVKAVIDVLAKHSGKTEEEKFAEALKLAIVQVQANFTTTLTELPSDSLIEKLKENKYPCSRQTLPALLEGIEVKPAERHQISFFGNTLQGYKLAVLEEALKTYEAKVA